MRTCVIFNPTAKGDKARHFYRHLGEVGTAATLMQTAAAGDARRLAAKAVADGFEIIAAAGGDGTLNEVLNGIGDAPQGFERARLGVLPLGTVNVFAKELGLPMELDVAWRTILQGREAAIDLPAVEFSEKGVRVRRHFAQLAGAGLDARAIELVHWPLKKKIGPLAYVVAGLQALSQTSSKLLVNDGQRTLSGELVLVGNGRLYGGRFRIFPEADLHDGLLDVCVFPRVNWLTLARCGPGLLLSGSLPSGTAEIMRVPTFSVTSPDGAPLELDGELVGHLPATFSVQRNALRVIVP